MRRNTQSAVPRYHRFSPYNFHQSNFLAAAKKFVELREALVAAEERYEAEHPHEYFVNCDVCDWASELRSHYNQFAIQFAYVWARKLIESQPQPKKEPTIECTVCRREIPENEYYAEHISVHPCE